MDKPCKCKVEPRADRVVAEPLTGAKVVIYKCPKCKKEWAKK